MRRLIAAIALTIAAASSLTAQTHTRERITVQQLEDAVAAERASPDKKAAQKLDGLELTERLAASRFAQLKEALPGPESRQRLRVIADAAEFLDLPQRDILPDAKPDPDTLRDILVRTAEFVSGTVKKMPNFSATRTTIRYRDYIPPFNSMPPVVILTPGIYHLMDNAQARVRYDNGKEESEPLSGKKAGQRSARITGVANLGLFGPLLGVVVADMLRSRMMWGYWEQGASGPLAVFRFSVPQDNAHYKVQYCCVSGQPSKEFFPPYHGEIAIDAETGRILRIVVEADVQSTGLLSRSDLLVEYGEVPIGSKKYVCPLHSASITTEAMPDRPGPNYAVAGETALLQGDLRHVTWINDIAFTDYHVFASEIRILPDGGSTP